MATGWEVGMQDMAVGFFSGLVFGFALTRFSRFVELAAAMIAAAILCDIIIDGIEGYLNWTRLALASLTGFWPFLLGIGAGAGLGVVVGIRTRSDSS